MPCSLDQAAFVLVGCILEDLSIVVFMEELGEVILGGGIIDGQQGDAAGGNDRRT